MGTMDGFFLGQMLAPIPTEEHNEAEQAWRDRAGREMARAKAAKERAEKAENQLVAMEERAEKAEKQVGNLTVSLEKEHKRFLLERRERIGYMKGWALRGKVLTENCGYRIDRVDAECDVLGEKYGEKLEAIALKENAQIDKEAGF